MRPRKHGRFIQKVTTQIGSYLVEVTLECYPGSPGRIHGDPDDCYPPEPDMAELLDILVLETEDGDKTLVGTHVDWDIDIDDDMIERAFAAQADADAAAYEAYCESKLDAMREGD